MDEISEIFDRATLLLDRLEKMLPAVPAEPDWNHLAYQWRQDGTRGWLSPVPHPHRVELDDLLCMDRQKAEVTRNTSQFIRGRPANNVLLWGSRGTGKSTLIKALLSHFAPQGLRLIEVEPEYLINLTDVALRLRERPEKFIVYCDDLSFEDGDPGYKALKAALEGSISAPPDNVLVYATSNRRHLIPEYRAENQEAKIVAGELHHGEAVEEKISLSERFGLWLSFYPYSQVEYLAICDHWLQKLATRDTRVPEVRQAALQWALYRGSRSGRVARQFAMDQAGRR